ACERDARTGAAAHFSKRRWCIVHRDDAEKAFPFTEVHGAELGFADTNRVRQHGLKNRLELTRRSADDAEDLGCRGLLLHRLAWVVRALAQLVEQPRVLDGDDGLSCKIAYQLDLLLAERPHLLAVNVDRADRLIFLDHRDAK